MLRLSLYVNPLASLLTVKLRLVARYEVLWRKKYIFVSLLCLLYGPLIVAFKAFYDKAVISEILIKLLLYVEETPRRRYTGLPVPKVGLQESWRGSLYRGV